ncbi:WS/DGAT/MGAT family O-acyltransferase [Hydrocarboniclastica marina]|uniref:diacylglycerol O-acyltransferase n=1 Tax=Hydrocarboniclastica marina TaxID=2259620 RepID=A0A4P7XK35_9ALTE|nr:wax ester/triacylglycerol synthase family O-acyltransferase [Hydrocarboniclastica marina]QCF26914.1 wax ester/triacylglycerol synthase family O-acyltransferase [Hydrocarboniclastica marina]
MVSGSSLKGTPMAAVDKSWLRMESASNCMMIGVVLIFDRPIGIPALRQLLEERFLKFQRFRQIIQRKGERCHWVDDPNFDLDNHLHSIALPAPASKKELQTVFGDLNSSHLDPNRPLWQIHHVDNYGEGSALLIRIHHCIADGISLVRVLLSLTDDNADAKVTKMPGNSIAPKMPPAPGWQKRINGFMQSLSQTRQQVTAVADKSWRKVRHDPTYLLHLGHEAWRVANECISLGLRPFDPPTRLKGSLSGRKQVAWAEPLDLAEVKQVAKALKGTVNDVLLTAATGALHEFLKESGAPIPPQGIHVAVPFNLRPPQEPVNKLGNQFGLVLVPLPVGTACPLEQFSKVQQDMNQLKNSYQAQVSYSLLNVFGRGPDILEKMALEVLSRKASAVMTNVPGPRNPVYLCGARLTQPMFWVPQTGDIGVGLSIFSYEDQVQFGLVSDKRLIGDPDAVVAQFVQSFNALKRLAATIAAPEDQKDEVVVDAAKAFSRQSSVK